MDERDLIERFRMRVKDILPENMYNDTPMFYRFLKARDFDMDEAEKMLRKHMIWRKLYQIDTILEDFKPLEFFTRRILPTVLGFCKEGSLVVYTATGKLDIKELLHCTELNRYCKHMAWSSEMYLKRIQQQKEISGRNVQKITIIADLDKFSFSNATYKGTTDILLKFTSMLQDNYPELMKASYIINAPTYAMIVVKIVKAIMSKAMTQKIHIFGNDGWKEKLLEQIDADVLPAFLGGNRTDPDGNPLCKTFVNHGGKLSPEYFLSDEERYFKNRPEVEKIIVPNKDKKKIALEVKEVESVIRWEFYCKTHIHFGLYRELSKQNPEEVIPLTKYNTSDGTEKNSYKVRIPGKYILVFDNSFSWMASKEVEYCIEVLKCAS